MKKLNVLMITQKVDKNDDILGFMHEWAKKLSEKTNKLNIIALSVGEYNLPDNVEVFSLGKEQGENKLTQSLRLYKKTLSLLKKKQVDVVFVHMNQIYVFSLAPLLKAFGVPLVFWKAHGHLAPSIKLAVVLSDAITTSSEQGFRLKTNKKHIVGQGIDTEKFKKRPKGESGKKVLCIGRISPIKRYEDVISAAEILKKSGKLKDLIFDIIGKPPNSDMLYLNSLKKQVKDKGLEKNINFVGSIPHHKIPKYYSNCDIFLNPSSTGSLDKTVLEAMASERLVLTSNEAYQPVLSNYSDLMLFSEGNVRELASKLEKLFSLSKSEKEVKGAELRKIVIKDHNIDNLTNNIYSVLEEVAQ